MKLKLSVQGKDNKQRWFIIATISCLCYNASCNEVKLVFTPTIEWVNGRIRLIDQTLLPNEKSTYSITFYIDPKIISDLKASDIKDINISYTFLNT